MVVDSSVYDKQVAWKQHGQRKLASKSQELRAQMEQHCTFAPKTNARSLAVPEDEEDRDRSTVEIEAALLHPTESQGISIQMHLARQEKAREHVIEAQQKLGGVQQMKNFNKVTTVEPFALSSTNWKPRHSTIESPTPEYSGSSAVDEDQQDGKLGVKTKTKAMNSKSSRCSHTGCNTASTTKAEETWESERATLVSIIDAQRRELALREQAQQEAVRVADRFATATQAFEERLVAVEQTTVKELQEVKRLLANQAAATDIILTSLGIARRPGSSSGTRYD